MYFNRFIIPLLALFAAFILDSCSPVPPAAFYETDGIVSIDVSAEQQIPGWRKVNHSNSTGLLSKPSEADSAQSLEFSFYLSSPGNYSFWVLTTGYAIQEESNRHDITILGPEKQIYDRFRLKFPSDDRLIWTDKRSDDSRSLITLETAGFHTVRIRSGGTDGIQIHKIHMARNNSPLPSGLGLPSSVSPDVNAADLFSEREIMMPPDWYFGLIYGVKSPPAKKAEGQDSWVVEQFPTPPDGAWRMLKSREEPDESAPAFQDGGTISGFELHKSIHLQGDTVTPAGSAMIRAGHTYAVSDQPLPLSQVEALFSAFRADNPANERGLLLRPLSGNSLPDSWQYPAPLLEPADVSWSSPPGVYDGRLKPGGLKEAVQSITDPTLSTYNNPFLSIPLATGPMQIEEDSELFIRNIQIASFMPVMHLIGGSNQNGELSATQQRVLQKYSGLRKRLFPYIYTYAHRMRQNGKGIVNGFRDHPGQFMFGDAFLVAPITDDGVRERGVHFPGEGIWYDMDTGRTYRAGQTWIVEAPLEQLPVFVKSGSVIPYRREASAVRSGSNDTLLVDIYTGGAGTFRLVEDDGMTRDYRRAKAARTMFRYNEVAGQLRLTIGAVQSGYDGMSDHRTYDLRFLHAGEPDLVSLNGEAVPKNGDQYPRWEYDDTQSTITIHLKNRWKHEKMDIAITPKVSSQE
ncbi:MAG: DUF5110 domain-containing protein [Bacteroidetes bacterium]|jgi:hypothetical protein|nr:DUF5110 domain-containing protein [Bacteroidota bacterium]